MTGGASAETLTQRMQKNRHTCRVGTVQYYHTAQLVSRSNDTGITYCTLHREILMKSELRQERKDPNTVLIFRNGEVKYLSLMTRFDNVFSSFQDRGCKSRLIQNHIFK
jgi:hypothetical protein